MRVAVLQTLGLGDFLTAIPALRALRSHFCDSHLTWIGKREYLSLIEPIFDDVIDLRYLTEPIDLPSFDCAVNLHGSGPVSHQRLHRSPEIIGFYNERYSPFGPLWSSTCHIRGLWSSLLISYGIKCDPENFRLGHEAEGDDVLLHVDARDKDRWWPIERFQDVIHEFANAEVIGERLSKPKTLAETVNLVRSAKLVIGVDSGVAHLAYAYSRPTVTLFGPAPAARWGPPKAQRHSVLGNLSHFDAINPDGPCSPHLLSVTSGEVVIAARELLSRGEALPNR